MARRKSYKSMSVNELVKAREELVEKMTQIDEILGKAVEAVRNTGVVPKQQSSPVWQKGDGRVGFDPAFGPSTNYPSQPQSMGAQVAVSTEAPVIAPRNGSVPDQSSGFTIFDADAYARKQAEAEQQYLVNNPGEPVPPEYDFNTEQMSSEISSIKEQLEEAKGANNEGDSSTDTE